MSKPLACAVEGCALLADWLIYPDHRKRAELAVGLCDPHHEEATASSGPRRNVYAAANRLIRKSLA